MIIRKNSVEAILAPFAKMREQLIDLARVKTMRVHDRNQRIDALRIENTIDTAEAQKAAVAANRLDLVLEHTLD